MPTKAIASNSTGEAVVPATRGRKPNAEFQPQSKKSNLQGVELPDVDGFFSDTAAGKKSQSPSAITVGSAQTKADPARLPTPAPTSNHEAASGGKSYPVASLVAPPSAGHAMPSAPSAMDPGDFQTDSRNRQHIIVAAIAAIFFSLAMATLTAVYALDYVNRPMDGEPGDEVAGAVETEDSRDSGQVALSPPAASGAAELEDENGTTNDEVLEPAELVANEPPVNEVPERTTALLPTRSFETSNLNVVDVAMSKNGVIYAASGYDIAACEARSGREIDRRSNLEELNPINLIAVSPDARFLLAAGTSGLIKIWSLNESGRLTDHGTFDGHDQSVTSISFSGEGTTVVSGDQDGSLLVWDVQSSSLIKSYKFLDRNVSAFVSDDGNTICATDGRSYFTINRDDPTSRRTYELSDRGQFAAFSHDGSSFALANGSEVLVYDSTTRDIMDQIDCRYQVWSLEFSHDGSTLFAGSNGFVYQWDVDDGEEFRTYASAAAGYVQTMTQSVDGKWLITIGNRNTGLIGISELRHPAGSEWQPFGDRRSDAPMPPRPIADEIRQAASELQPGLNNVEHLLAEFETGGVEAIEFARSGMIFSAGSSDTIKGIDWSRNRLIEERNDFSWQLWPVLSVSDSRLACGGNSGLVYVYDITASGKIDNPLEVRAHGENQVVSMDFSNDESIVASAGKDGTFYFWNSMTGEQRFQVPGFGGRAGSVFFRDDQTALLTDGRTLASINMDDGTLVSKSRIGTAAAKITFSPDGRFLASSIASRVSVLDVVQSNLPDDLGFEGVIWDSEFSPDGRFLFIARGGSGDVGEIIQWDIQRAQAVTTFYYGDDSAPACISLSSDGRYLAAAGIQSDEPLRVYLVLNP
ncbi:MAG: WD40 repeat domain-containing protein [Planctomycetota bacterium]